MTRFSSKEERFEALTSSAPLRQGLKSKTIRGGAIAMTGEAIDFVLRIGSIAVLARLLVPEHFGLLAMVTAVTTVAERFKDLGLSAATVQRPQINHAQVSALFWVNAAIGGALMLLVSALAHPIAAFYGDARLIPITLAIAISFLWSGSSTQHQALLRRTMRFYELAVIQVGASILSIALAVVLAVLDFGYWALVAREVSRNVFVALGSWYFLPWVPSRPRRSLGTGEMLRFGGNLTAFNFLYYLSSSLGQVIIGKLFGAATLGIYRQGFALVLAPVQQVLGPVTSVADAALCRLQAEPETYRRYYRQFLLLVSMTTLPLVALLAIFAEQVVLVLLGPQWIEAAPIFRILALAVLFSPSVSTAGTVAVSCGYARRFFWLGVIESTALIAFFFIGIPWGPNGVVSAHVWAFYLLAPPWVYWCFRATPVDVRLFVSTIARPAIATMVMAVVATYVRDAQLAESAFAVLMIGTAVSATVYLATWALLPGGRVILLELFQHFRTGR